MAKSEGVLGRHIAQNAAVDFDATPYGLHFDDFASGIQESEAYGRWIMGVEVIRQLSTAVGLRWRILPTRQLVVFSFPKRVYRVFGASVFKEQCDARKVSMCDVPADELGKGPSLAESIRACGGLEVPPA